MIALLDRYLLRRAALAFVMILTVLVVIIVGLDLTNRVGGALDHEDGARLIARFYLLKIPEWLVAVAAPALLMACLAVCAPMLRRGEFVALSAGGRGTRGATRALLALAAIIGVGTAMLSDRIVPPYSAESERIDDLIDKQDRDGKCWQVLETGSAWFIAHTKIRDEEDFDFSLVAIAPPSGGLVVADNLLWDGAGWRLEGGLCRFEILPDGSYRHSTPARIDLVDELALPYGPTRLYRELLPAHTLTGPELLARGGARNRGIAYGRWAAAFGPLLAVMAALPLFVRFRNKDNLIVASITAAAMASVPLIIIGMSGIVGDTVAADPALVTGTALIVAAMPSLWLYMRWRL